MVCPMPMMTVRNLSDEVHRALRARAELHGRSTEAEVRAILEEVVKPEARVSLGTMLTKIRPKGGLNDDECALFERNKSSARSVDFE